MKKQWILKPQASPDDIQTLSKSINVDSTIANLLLQRGIDTFDKARDFFRPKLDNMYDPYLMKDMDKAVERLDKAVSTGEKIMVYGDYDVDGTTSVAMMYSFLRNKASRLTYYIPDRYHEGYGISFKGIDSAKENGCSLIIALDCGIKAVEKVEYAKKRGIEVIICDHHEPGEQLPDAVAVLDPKRNDCSYPFKELSGCGVGFKLIHAFARKHDIPFHHIEHYLDLVTVSIASDIVPIIDENRIFAFYGLKKINNKPRIGLKAILDVANIEPGNLKINDLVFKVGPRINAAGRMEHGKFAVDLLVCDNKNNAAAMADKIDEDNTERKWFDNNITKEALSLLDNDSLMLQKKSTVLYNPEWHKGVLGIVASRLIEHHYKPTIVLTRSNGFVTGSARSVDGFNLYKAIEKCQHLLESFGGHMYAAGLTIKEENVNTFISEFENAVDELITEENMVPRVDIDMEIKLNDITPRFFKVLKQFEPFGPGNMSPIFVSKSVKDTGFAQRVGAEGDHLKMFLMDKDATSGFPAIAFGLGHHLETIINNEFDVCYSVEENFFKGKRTIQLKIKDIREN